MALQDPEVHSAVLLPWGKLGGLAAVGRDSVRDVIWENAAMLSGDVGETADELAADIELFLGNALYDTAPSGWEFSGADPDSMGLSEAEVGTTAVVVRHGVPARVAFAIEAVDYDGTDLIVSDVVVVEWSAPETGVVLSFADEPNSG